MDPVGASVALFGCVVLWLSGYGLHRKILPASSDAIRLPPTIRVLFGVRSQRVLSGRGIVAQLSAYVATVILVLLQINAISQETAGSWCGWLGVVLGLLALAISIRAKS